MAVFIAASVLLVLSGCEAEQPASKHSPSSQKNVSREEVESSPPSTYHFRFKQEDVAGIVEVLINGFPVNRGGGSVTNNPVVPLDLNTALVGTGNKLTIRVEPRLYEGQKLSITEVKVYGKVTRDEEGRYPVPGARITEAEVDSAYRSWSKQARKRWASYQSSVDRGTFDSMKVWVERHPLTVSATFDNEAGPDFSRIFEEAPRLPDTPATRERLKDYAMRLRKLFAQEDTLGVYQAHRPKFQAIDFSKQKALGVVGGNWFSYAWQVDFDRTDLSLRRWSDGRVWEIYRDDKLSQKLSKQALFLAGEERLQSWHKVYVAQLDGELRVVR